MLTRHERSKVTWIDLESPTHEELDSVMTEFGIDARIEEEIISPTPYPISITFPGYVYLILHFPTAIVGEPTRMQEVDFIIGKNFLITARYEVVESLHNLHRVFEAEELLGISNKAPQAELLIEEVMRRLYAAISTEAERAALKLDKIESDIFSGRERQAVHSISDIGRSLLRFETVLARHADPLAQFLNTLSTTAFFGKSFTERAAHIEAERDHAAALIASYRIVATELRSTNDSLLSASQNEVMKVLTIMSFVILPLTLITGLFGMNIQDMPVVDLPGSFGIIVTIMVITAACFFFFFKARRWF